MRAIVASLTLVGAAVVLHLVDVATGQTAILPAIVAVVLAYAAVRVWRGRDAR